MPTPEEIERLRKALEEANKREADENAKRYPQPSTDLYTPGKSTETKTETRQNRR